MSEIGTGLALLAGGLVGGGGKDLIIKILGPTSDYIGEQLKDWTQKKINNTSRIFENAQRKLGNKISDEGAVSPKVLKGILDEGAWCEEELQIEYFGGVLASSRTGSSRDDRGAYFISIISSLTSYQIRSHYLFYQLLYNNFKNEYWNINDGKIWKELEIFLPFDTFYKAMAFDSYENLKKDEILSHSIWGLSKESLINNQFKWGSISHLKTTYKDVNEEGIIFQPTKLGVELFMWVYGLGQKNINNFFYEDFKKIPSIEINNSVRTKDKKQ